MKSMEKMNVEMKKGMDPDATKAWAKMMLHIIRERSGCRKRS